MNPAWGCIYRLGIVTHSSIISGLYNPARVLNSGRVCSRQIWRIGGVRGVVISPSLYHRDLFLRKPVQLVHQLVYLGI